MQVVKRVIITLISFLTCILLFYVITDIGFCDLPMITSGLPYSFGSIITCLFVPCCVYVGMLDEY